MTLKSDEETSVGHNMRGPIGAVIGGLTGLGISSAVYVTVNPILERSSGLIREMQGFLWNLVPLLTAIGVAIGWWVASGRGHRSRTGGRQPE